MALACAFTISVSVARRPADVLAYVRDPRNLTAWAPGFAAAVREESGRWLVDTADGATFSFAFAPENDFGIADHRVTDPDGVTTDNPMRVLRNGDGSEVLFTLFGEPDAVQDDLAAVRSDLELLKQTLEGDV